MAGRAKKQAQRERRKAKVRAEKAAKQAMYQAKIEIGKNTKSRADRLRKQSLRQRLVRNVKQLSSAAFAYVPPSQYWTKFYAHA